MKRKYLFLLACCSVWLSTYAAPAERSDTLDIRKTIIHFTITDFVSKNISARGQLLIKSLQSNVNQINLDLQNFTVDSVFISNQQVAYVMNSNLLQITPAAPMNVNDSVWVDVYYQGIPSPDPTWGGFNFVSNYAFQLGVGFSSQPHSFGRSWMPCFDNMVERCSYEFYITTTPDKMAVCNGMLLDSVLNANNTKTWHWKLDEEIPSYLASVAVSNYVLVEKNVTGSQGTIDAWIACEAIDTAKVNGSFAHLQESFSMMENHFGDHMFPRVGYSLVPFNGGAMEHATNIAIGKAFIDGTLNYETLIAHELAHHWFGDNITCSTVEDMWLNEGFASYCENLHLESVYGYEAYMQEMRDKHYTALFRGHVDDDGYKPISPMDSLNTYGTTVYIKGADALHSLRTYLGDADFFDGLKQFVAQQKFSDVNSYQLRDALSASSGKNLNSFFDNWIFAPGFTHFSIDSMYHVPSGSGYDVHVYLRQRKHQSIDYYSEVPLEIGFYNNQWQMHPFSVLFSGRCMELVVHLPFIPTMVWVDPQERISDAITEEHRVIKTVATQAMPLAKSSLLVKGMQVSGDSSLYHIAHHWVAPDRFKQASSFPGYVLNDKRYWTVSGINLANLTGLIRFDYNGGTANNFIDSSWIKNKDDSIRLFYRKDAREEWQFANDSLFVGNPNDKIGYVFSKEIKAGEYCFGIKRSGYIDTLQSDAPSSSCNVVLDIPLTTEQEETLQVFPNPTSHSVTLRGTLHATEATNYQITDMFGRFIQEGKVDIQPSGNVQQQINLSTLATGCYLLHIQHQHIKIIKQ